MESKELSFLEENINAVRNNMESAARRANRKISDIILVAATKTVPFETINRAIGLGITDVGENRVQEFVAKIDHLNPSRTHFIGALQTNKVKYIVGRADLIHSVDSEKLAKEIDLRAGKTGKIQDILIEVNVGNEASKAGVLFEKAKDFMRSLAGFSHIQVRGFMCIPPASYNEEELRGAFRRMRKLFIDTQGETLDNICVDTLSMGMSSDYAIAIEEGATMVRVGTAIFGKRDYGKAT